MDLSRRSFLGTAAAAAAHNSRFILYFFIIFVNIESDYIL